MTYGINLSDTERDVITVAKTIEYCILVTFIKTNLNAVGNYTA